MEHCVVINLLGRLVKTLAKGLAQLNAAKVLNYAGLED